MLNEFAEGVWETSEKLKVFGFEVGHRMTVFRLASGEIAVHSPTHLSEAMARNVEALGPVKTILAPSAMHDLYLGDWMNRFPRATLLHSPALKLDGLDRSRAKPLTRERIGDLHPFPIRGMPKVQEFVFHHSPTASLIVCDLLFNLPPGRGFQKLLQKMNGIYEEVGVSKFFKSFITDHEAFRASVQEILSLPVERLIVGHGSNINRDGGAYLNRAFNWLTKH